MLDRGQAETFAREWVSAWNDKDLDAILAHYAEDVVFHSPRIAIVLETQSPVIVGKAALRNYWSLSLDHAPDLFFAIESTLVSSDAIVILYTNHRGQSVAETFIFNSEGDVRESVAAYR